MKKSFALAWLCLLFSLWSNAQSTNNLDPVKKKVAAARTGLPIDIDGRLEEASWQTALPATGFTQLEPRLGEPAGQLTDVRILYDNTGIYVGASLHDTSPDSIQLELTQRDQIGNADWFGIFIDAYRDGINGMGFIVSSSGVQFDAKYSVFGEDENWDAVWQSAVTLSPDGWVAELKIPYSAIRFPRQEEQVWHINFGRLIQRTNQKCFWSPIDPQKNGLLNQSGYLTSVEKIESPVRLQATPFIAVYAQHQHDRNANPKNAFGQSFNGGMDLKYGISDAFTLDLTLIPDFGEARSDNQVLNLSPFEVRFEENRQFFTEGTELFNKGGLFYSRRVGGQPLYYGKVYDQLLPGERVVENPQQSRMYNATKISGRNRKGLGLGFFNATTGNTYARVKNDETGRERDILSDPLSNYNVLVLDQSLPNNSYFTVINTTVLRSGDAYDANVSGIDFDLHNKANKYAVLGGAKLSQQFFGDSTSLGHAFSLNLRKISGALNFNIGYREESDRYNPNDLGYLSNNNTRNVIGWAEYGRYKPFWFFNRGGAGMWMGYMMQYRPAAYNSFGIENWIWGETKGFWRVNLFSFTRPFGAHDYFETRESGRYLEVPAFRNVGFYVRTDSRKAFQIGLNGGYGSWSERDRYRLFWYVEPRYRVNDHLTFSVELSNQLMNNDVGFVSKTGQDIIMGHRDRTTIENVLNTKYTFNNKMELTLRTRHYWSKVRYTRFHGLGDGGDLLPTDYNGNHDANFNAFNVDMIYRWRFAPGSDLFLIWKNNVLSYGANASVDYFRNLNGLFDNPVGNSLSLKVVYFLDYLSLARRG